MRGRAGLIGHQLKMKGDKQSIERYQTSIEDELQKIEESETDQKLMEVMKSMRLPEQQFVPKRTLFTETNKGLLLQNLYQDNIDQTDRSNSISNQNNRDDFTEQTIQPDRQRSKSQKVHTAENKKAQEQLQKKDSNNEFKSLFAQRLSQNLQRKFMDTNSNLAQRASDIKSDSEKFALALSNAKTAIDKTKTKRWNDFLRRQFKIVEHKHYDKLTVGFQDYQICKYSLACLSSRNYIRRFCLRLAFSKTFNDFILLVIVINSILLSTYDYQDRDNLTNKNKIIDLFQQICSIIFIVESLVKIIAQGVIMSPYAYFRNSWNILDFIIAISGISDFIQNSKVNLKPLRVLRVLRPLKSINKMKSMRILISTLLKSLPRLLNVLVFVFFNLFLFAILGLQQFGGSFYGRCRLTEVPENSTYWAKDESITRPCSLDGIGNFQCPEGTWCGHPGEYGISLEDDGVYQNSQIQFGICSFDNIVQAFLAVFQMITMDSWTVIIYNCMDCNIKSFSALFGIVLIIFGSFYLLNLILAIIMESFVEIFSLETQKRLEIDKNKAIEDQKKFDEIEKSQELQFKILTQGLDAKNSSAPMGLLSILAKQAYEFNTTNQPNSTKAQDAQKLAKNPSISASPPSQVRRFSKLSSSDIMKLLPTNDNTALVQKKNKTDKRKSYLQVNARSQANPSLQGLDEQITEESDESKDEEEEFKKIQTMDSNYLAQQNTIKILQDMKKPPEEQEKSSVTSQYENNTIKSLRISKSNNTRTQNKDKTSDSLSSQHTIIDHDDVTRDHINNFLERTSTIKEQQNDNKLHKRNSTVQQGFLDVKRQYSNLKQEGNRNHLNSYNNQFANFIVFNNQDNQGGNFTQHNQPDSFHQLDPKKQDSTNGMHFQQQPSLSTNTLHRHPTNKLQAQESVASSIITSSHSSSYLSSKESVSVQQKNPETIETGQKEITHQDILSQINEDNDSQDLHVGDEHRDNQREAVRRLSTIHINQIQKHNERKKSEVMLRQSENKTMSVFAKAMRSQILKKQREEEQKAMSGSMVRKRTVMQQLTLPSNVESEYEVSNVQVSRYAMNLFGGSANQDKFTETILSKFGMAQQIKDEQQRINAEKGIAFQNQFKLNIIKANLREKYLEKTKDRYGQVQEQNVLSMVQQKLMKKEQQHGDGMSKIKSMVEKQSLVFDIQKEMKEQAIKRQIQAAMAKRFQNILVDKVKLEHLDNEVRQRIKKDEMDYRAKDKCLIKCCLKLVESTGFQWFINLAIFANTIFLALDHHDIDYEFNKQLELANSIFYTIFLVEMILKLIGYGFEIYVKDSFNVFDGVIVILSTIDVLLVRFVSIRQQGSLNINSLRVIRLLRVFKLIKVWKGFQEILNTILSTLKDLNQFSILLSLFIFIYSLIGMEMFAFRVKFDSDNRVDLSENGSFPLFTFNGLTQSIISVFVVLANDGWSTIYFDHYRAVSEVQSSIYFVSLLIFGQYVLLNLFLAILLQNFEEDSVQEQAEKQEEERIQLMTQASNTTKLTSQRSKRNSIMEKEMTWLDEEFGDDRSLCCLTLDNKLRSKCIDLTNKIQFEITILTLITLSSILLAIENPLNNPDGAYMKSVHFFNQICTLFFVFEAFVKIIAKGLYFNGPQSYLKNKWNILDFIIVILSVLNDTPLLANYRYLRILRLFRVLRPLRVISKNKGLQISIKALFQAIPDIINVLTISFIIFSIFSIMGVNFMKGKLYYCVYDGVDLDQTLLIDKWDCINLGGTWINHYQKYDNTLDGLQALFEISATVGWAFFMKRAMYSYEIDMEPVADSYNWVCIFFIFFVIVGSMFISNLFVCIVISTYNREKEKLGNDFMMTEQQKNWFKTKLIIIHAQPIFRYQDPPNLFRRIHYKISQSKIFQYFIFACIIANTINLCVKWYEMDDETSHKVERINYIFLLIFTAEAYIKIVGYGEQYFKDGWNKFDFFIVFGTWICQILAVFGLFEAQTESLIVIRGFRILRIFRILKQFKNLQIIYQALVITIPAMLNVGMLLLLFLFIYSVLGVNLFATIKLSGSMNDLLNFQTFFNAFFTLIRAMTGENWHEMLYLQSKQNSILYQCIDNPTYQDYVDNGYETIGCGSKLPAIIFFFSYYILLSLIFMNLFIGIVLQGFQDTNKNEVKMFSTDILEMFQTAWSYFDPNATGFIPKEDIKPFMFKCGPPLAFDESYKDSEELQDEFLENVGVKLYQDTETYSFTDVFENLALLYVIQKEVEERMGISSVRNRVDSQGNKDGQSDKNINSVQNSNRSSVDSTEKDEQIKNKLVQKKIKDIQNLEKSGKIDMIKSINERKSIMIRQKREESLGGSSNDFGSSFFNRDSVKASAEKLINKKPVLGKGKTRRQSVEANQDLNLQLRDLMKNKDTLQDITEEDSSVAFQTINTLAQQNSFPNLNNIQQKSFNKQFSTLQNSQLHQIQEQDLNESFEKAYKQQNIGQKQQTMNTLQMEDVQLQFNKLDQVNESHSSKPEFFSQGDTISMQKHIENKVKKSIKAAMDRDQSVTEEILSQDEYFNQYQIALDEFKLNSNRKESTVVNTVPGVTVQNVDHNNMNDEGFESRLVTDNTNNDLVVRSNQKPHSSQLNQSKKTIKDYNSPTFK